MKELIEKLEAAEAGARELDARIHALVLGDDWVAEFENQRVGDWLVYCNTRFSDRAKQHREARKPPPYTTSIDAALPGERIISVWETTEGLWCATHRTPGGDDIYGTGHTEALARRIVVLKALDGEG